MSLKALTNFLRKIKCTKGYTLVELLIVIALIGIVSIPIGASLIFGLKIFDSETAVDEVFQDQLSAFSEMKEALRSDPYHVQIVTVSGIDTLQIGPDSVTARNYTLSAGNLIRSIGPQSLDNPGTVLCDHITAFELANIEREENIEPEENEAVTQLRLTLIASVRNRNHTLSTEISLRRY